MSCRIRLGRFPNAAGLAQRGGNSFRATPASGLPQEFNPGMAGAAEVIGGMIEQSNTDVGHELIDLILSGNQFRASLAVLDTTETLFHELFAGRAQDSV